MIIYIYHNVSASNLTVCTYVAADVVLVLNKLWTYGLW